MFSLGMETGVKSAPTVQVVEVSFPSSGLFPKNSSCVETPSADA